MAESFSHEGPRGRPEGIFDVQVLTLCFKDTAAAPKGKPLTCTLISPLWSGRKALLGSPWQERILHAQPFRTVQRSSSISP